MRGLVLSGAGAAVAIVALASLFFPGHPRAAQRPLERLADRPQFTAQGRLVRPANYREWIYLSSGLGMQYGAPAGQPQKFTNVFVQPLAYRYFVTTGRWPGHAMFVVEERASSSRGSINRAGHFQTDLAGLGVEVKDAKRFPETWAYFLFGPTDTTAAPQPKKACWECHQEHAAVEHTFVQFYPTLQPVARKFHTYDAKKAASH
jgi:hypothetical protein